MTAVIAQKNKRDAEDAMKDDELIELIGKSAIEMLPLSVLKLDRRVQRAVIQVHVKKIFREFDPSALGTMAVSRRANGDCVILDGMHRWSASNLWLRDQGKDADKFLVRCEVWTGLTLNQEAAIFRQRNNTHKVGALYSFLVAVNEGDEEVLGVVETLDKHGWSVSETKKNGTVGGVTALLRWHRQDPWALDRAFAVLTKVWGHEARAADYRIFGGLAHMFHYYRIVDSADGTPRDGFKAEDLAGNLMKTTGIDELIGKSTVLRSSLRLRPEVAMAMQFVNVYNFHKSATALKQIEIGKRKS